ncbi:piggyBac transposable element-derived protein 4-like isoform X1 [Leguminivora glycinivorella]|uniref:piggyBac transposable element-derived protein 4-like isoform X1 n=1 Tax=Leguminivora glycinivorella TaxID=1035111 RepID=UPI00200F0844|nr:piggyBac transposable element-derived protein 4-like isoform X1 [Leguminivora glycinivorella]
MSSGFITESEILEQRRRRQEEWDKVRTEDQPKEAPEEPYDTRPLYQRLEEQKMRKDAEYEEAHKLKNMIRGLDDDEVGFLDLVERSKAKAAQQISMQEQKEMQEFRERVSTLAESEELTRLRAQLAPARTTPAQQQRNKLQGVVVRKRKASELEAEKGAAPPPAKNNTNNVTDSMPATGDELGAMRCVGVLPGLRHYGTDSSSDTGESSDSEPEDKCCKPDLLGRRPSSDKHKEKNDESGVTSNEGELSEDRSKKTKRPKDPNVISVDSGSEADDEDFIRSLLSVQYQANFKLEPAPEETFDTYDCINQNFYWSQDFTTFSGRQETYTFVPGSKISTQSPYELFTSIWDRNIMQKIADETNKYAWQTITPKCKTEGGIPNTSRLSRWKDTTVEELYLFFAVLIFMPFCHREKLADYWSTGRLEMSNFRSLMSRNRFQLLLRFLHFVDNDTLLVSKVTGNEKKIAKIKPIIDYLNMKFNNLYVPGQYLSLNESYPLWKGQFNLERSVKNREQFGFQSHELYEARTGYLLKFLIDTSRGNDERSHAKTTLKLMQQYLDRGHSVAMDVTYTQVPLTRYLKTRRTDVIGLINKERPLIPEVIKNIDDKRLQKGELLSWQSGDISIISWKDAELTSIVSTYHKPDMVLVAQNSLSHMLPRIPLALHDYNKCNVDNKKMSYTMERKRGLKWYIKIFRRLLNSSILNAYVLYQSNCTSKPISHRNFRYDLAENLAVRYGITKVTTQPVSRGNEIRLDGKNDHYPTHTEMPTGKNRRSRRRCHRCQALGRRSQVTIMCSKCQVGLCVGQCWKEYHTLKRLNKDKPKKKGKLRR